MNKIKQIKKTYMFSAIIILGAAVLVSAYFVYVGLQSKNTIAVDDIVPTQIPNPTPQSVSKSESHQLLIEKINVSVPIIINTDGNNKEEYDKALENGIAHLKGSALPGKNGNVFIFGHSSYYPEKPGNYKQVFAKLNDLVPGDIFEIQSVDARYIYKILNKKIVEPNDVSVANQNNALKQITLMTCWPVGSTAQRLVVVGELVE